LGFATAQTLDVWLYHIVVWLTSRIEHMQAVHHCTLYRWSGVYRTHCHRMRSPLFTGELYECIISPIPIYCNNQGASNGKFHAHTKHIDLQFHFIWSLVKNWR
jgi:hypothetical protein